MTIAELTASVDWQHDVPPGLVACSNDLVPVKSNQARSVYKVACDNGESFFIKHLPGTGAREYLKTYIRDKAREEFEASRQLLEAGIDAVTICAIGNRGRERFLVSHNCPGLPAGQVWDEILSQQESRQTFIAALQAFVILLLENNVRHQDLHLNNLICRPADGSYTFTLIDVYGTAVDDSRNIDDQIEVMTPMRTGLMLLNRAERQQMWRDTSAAARQPTDYFRAMVYGSWRRQALRRYKRRRVKYLRQSSIIDSHQVADGHLRFFRDRVSASVVAGAVRQHQVAEARGELFKQKQKRSISKSTVEGRAVVVKGFRLDRISSLLSRDQRSWLNGARLWRYAIPCVEYLGWLRQASTAYIVMVDGGSNTFDKELATIVDDRDAVMRRLSQLGALVAHMHEMGVHFKDLKASNILIDPDTDSLILIDLDDVRFYQKLTPGGIRDNLQVLFESISPVVRGLIRRRVLTVYAAERGFLRTAYRHLYHSLDFEYQA